MAGWKPQVNGELASNAIAVAREVARRLSASGLLDQAIAEAPRQSVFANRNCWTPQSIAQGHAGLAVLYGYFDACFPDERWDLTARDHLHSAARAAEKFPDLPAGLFSGLSGLALAAWYLSRDGRRYSRLLNSLDVSICARTIAEARNLHGRSGVSFAEFDVISGVSGVGAYLLCRRGDPRTMTCLSVITQSLVDLLSCDQELPRWYTPPHLLGDEETRRYCPHGNLNFGLAHGIPAPLALLSLAYSAGIKATGLAEAIERTADWLCKCRCDDAFGVNWPAILPLKQVDTEGRAHLTVPEAASAPDGPGRCAWCYGSPGIARTLWLAGVALDREDYRQLAVSAMRAVFSRPIALRRIDSPTFCHGVAGLLAIALRFSNDMGRNAFSEEIEALTRQVLDSYKPDSLLGFRHLETRDNEMDQPGLLEGAPGVALTLLAASTSAEPVWDRLFLLS